MNKIYKYENEKWIIKQNKYAVNWDRYKKNEIFDNLIDILTVGGYAFGAYENDKLIGFAALSNKSFEDNNQYIQLKYIYISFGFRHKRIGNRLFNLCMEKAKEAGYKKIYLSVNNSEETQRFFLKLGFIDALEKNIKITENEPYCRQMEFVF